jgi:hypothetical protein
MYLAYLIILEIKADTVTSAISNCFAGIISPSIETNGKTVSSILPP